MNAYVAVTDYDWYSFLSQQDEVDEVNFWQPRPWGGRFAVLRRGEPLLFKLKAPHNAIAGGGFFESYADLPLSLAWDAFGVKNGAPDRQAVWDRIARLRRDRPVWYEDFTIGCIIEVQSHDVRNGLLLRSDLHRLFDTGYITVTPDYHVEASSRMRDDFNDGENYLRLHGKKIIVPEERALRPSPEALQWHNEKKFRG